MAVHISADLTTGSEIVAGTTRQGHRVSNSSVLIASIAHEVSGPLSGVITNAGTCLRMLAADPPNLDGARETVRRALRDGNRAADLITRVRALFSERTVTRETFDLNDVVREALTVQSAELRLHRTVVRAELAGNLPLVSADRVQLGQVIGNLLRNAAEAMGVVHERPRDLLVRTRAAVDRLHVAVRDAGPGLDPASLAQMFEPFYTTKQQGMGIGLAVSRAIVERHGGQLWAEQNDGPGATFRFWIPGNRTPE